MVAFEPLANAEQSIFEIQLGYFGARIGLWVGSYSSAFYSIRSLRYLKRVAADLHKKKNVLRKAARKRFKLDATLSPEMQKRLKARAVVS